MKRKTVSKIRENWQSRLEDIGFHFYTIEGKPYWDESAYYELTSAEVDHLEEVTEELNGMCLELVEHVIADKLFARLGIPERFADYVTRSWRLNEPTLYGRFDLWYDGASEPMMLEYNADTPTALFEASVVQYYWLQDFMPDEDQFNSIHEKLLDEMRDRIKMFVNWSTFHFSCVRDSTEDLTTVEYMRDVAIQAGITAKHLYIDDVGYDFDRQRFVDLENEEISAMFKLYPWEWLINEPFADQLLESHLVLLEPAWKMILSNKAILPLLWEMFPGHKNLLPAFFTLRGASVPYVEKPFFSREGDGIRVVKDFHADAPQVIYQEYRELPDFGGNYPVIGSWIVGSKAAGIGMREDTVPITNNMSRFVPHLFTL